MDGALCGGGAAGGGIVAIFSRLDVRDFSPDLLVSLRRDRPTPQRATGGGLEGVARGGAPLCLVAGLHSAEALELFSWLVPVVAAEQAVSSLQRLLPLWAAALLATLWLAARGRAWRVVTELLALLLLFWQLPPLAAFALYFALLHAPRSILLLPPLLPGLAGRQWLAAALWPTALSLAAALLALGWLQRLEGVALEQSLVQVLFIGLAALTLPHVLLWGWLALRPPGAAVR